MTLVLQRNRIFIPKIATGAYPPLQRVTMLVIVTTAAAWGWPGISGAQPNYDASLCITDWMTLANSRHADRVQQPANVRVVKPAG